MSSSDRSAIIYLRNIQREFLQELPERVRSMETIWESIESGQFTRENLENLRREAHTVRGESATFGFLWISQAAETVETSMKTLMDSKANGERPEVGRQIREVLKTYERYSFETLPDIPNIVPDAESPSPGEDRRLIFLVEDDEGLAKAMAMQLGHYGYEVTVFNSLDDLHRQIRERSPIAVVMDIIIDEGDMAGTDFIIDELRKGYAEPFHVVFTSVRADMEARLQAYRAGCDAYFTKPVDVNALADKLDQLTGRVEKRPYEILIVDDDAAQAEFYATTLRRAGMNVTVTSDPMQVLDQIETTRPDLILLDVYMPVCDGPELAAVLRQHEIHLSIPIVFLSAESDFDEQVTALAAGGDEFLTKPIEPRHLVAMVLSRAQHGRLLGTMIYQDTLTGLANHGKLLQNLRSELKRSAKEKAPLTFARLDLDVFKSVNEKHGTHAGDRVLRSLAGLLKKRLRKTDTIARYGGDEFAAILPGTTGAQAKEILEELTTSFAQLGHVVGEERFTVSLSCGLATYPNYPNAELLSEAAGNALAEAKRRGKSRVALFD